MATEIDTPVSSIEGIGPATDAALNAAGLHTVCDLLRVSVATLHAAVSSLASEDEVRVWRRMAALVQVAEVTPQWAEALVRGGIDAIDELSHKSLDELDTLFRDAVEHGIAPSAPELPQIAEMLKDAAVLQHTGALLGTVISAGGQPVANAELRINARDHRTDERGRFRIVRIPLGRSWPLRIKHAYFATLYVEAPHIAVDSSVIAGSVFTLLEASPGEMPMMLSELAGDALPATWDRAREVKLEPAQLREGDLLVFRQRYQSAPEAGLVSLLRSWQDGDLIVHTLRMPISVLPAEAKLTDQFRVVAGALVAAHMTPLDVHRYRIDRRMRKAFADRPAPSTNEEWAALVREQFRLRAEQGYYVFPGKTS